MNLPMPIWADSWCRLTKKNEALPYLLRTTELTTDPYSHKWAGAILVDNGQIEEGIPHLKKAVELKQDDGQVRFNLSGAYFLSGDTIRALSELEILLKKQPNFPDAKRFYNDLKRSYERTREKIRTKI